MGKSYLSTYLYLPRCYLLLSGRLGLGLLVGVELLVPFIANAARREGTMEREGTAKRRLVD